VYENRVNNSHHCDQSGSDYDDCMKASL